MTFDIVLLEKQVEDSLSKADIKTMLKFIKEDRMYPIEIEAHLAESSAMGFITADATDKLNYDYNESGLNDFIASIMDDMSNESKDGTYKFKNLSIFLKRDI